MKKSLITTMVAVCMMIGSGAFAQKSMVQAEGMARKQADKLKSELSLSDQQAQQVYEQLVWNMEQKKEGAKDAWAKTDAKMKEVLSPEQYAKWSEMEKQRMEKAKSKGHSMVKEGQRRGDRMMKNAHDKLSE